MRQLAFVLLGVTLAVMPAAAQIDPGTAMLERGGWEALNAGNPRLAAEHFRRALAGDAKNARLHFGAGVAAYMERRDPEAKAALERALELNPKLSDARLFLGQVTYRMGDANGAIRALERALVDAPGDTRIADQLERWRRESELHGRMQQSLNERFTVSFEGPEEAALAAHALESLDRAYWRIGQALSTYPNRPIAVVLYTTEQFRDITRAPSWSGGAYDGTIRVPVRGALDNPQELDRVLAHEFTHALVRQLAPRNVPTWLNEGIATALEADSLDWARTRVQNAAAPIALSALQSSFSRMTSEQALVAYATSALAVQRLLAENGGFAIANLLRDLGEGVAFDAAFTRRLQRPLAAFLADAP